MVLLSRFDVFVFFQWEIHWRIYTGPGPRSLLREPLPQKVADLFRWFSVDMTIVIPKSMEKIGKVAKDQHLPPSPSEAQPKTYESYVPVVAVVFVNVGCINVSGKASKHQRTAFLSHIEKDGRT